METPSMQRFLPFLVTCLLGFLFTPMALGQTVTKNTPLNAVQATNTRSPTLMVTQAGELIPMLVDSVDVNVVIRGLLAETTMTMVFRNPHNRVLAGELVFPLPAGATVSGYGLDVGGQLVEGVVVEKHQARIVFEKEVRREVVIDPGLVEHVRGNNFRTRVYPIPSGGKRTVMVRYVSELIGSSGEPVYLLPLQFEEPVGQFDLKAVVVRGTHRPTVTSGLSNFEFSKWDDRWIAKTTMTHASLTQDLRVALPKTPDLVVSVEKDGPQDTIFVIHDQPTVPVQSMLSSTQPERVHLWWDASMSHGKEERQTELEFLRLLLTRWNHLTLDVTPFRDQPEARQSFVIRGGDASAIENFLQGLHYDGGTDLADVQLNQILDGESYDLHLLVSDGIGTIGKTPGTPEIPVFTITAAASADHLLLRHLSTTSGGAHLNLGVMTTDVALAQIDLEPFSLLGVDYDPNEITDLYPTGRQPVSGRVHVTGKLISDQATVVLRYGHGKREVSRREVTLQRTAVSDTGLVPRFWAQRKVEHMMVAPELDRDRLLAVGRRYGIVTPETSLLVLETLEQHIEHNIEPPESRPQLRERWLAHQSQTQKRQERAQTPRIEQLVSLWRHRQKWWKTDFSNWRQKRFSYDQSTTEASSPASIEAQLTVPEPAVEVVADEAPAEAMMSEEAAVAARHLERESAERQRAIEEERLERATAASSEMTTDHGFSASAYAEPSAVVMDEPLPRNTVEQVVVEQWSPTGIAEEAAPMSVVVTEATTASADYAVAADEGVVAVASEPVSASPAAPSTLERGPTISIKAWDPKTPYMVNLKAQTSDRIYDAYYTQRPGFGDSPAYFLDCAVFLHEQNQPMLAKRVLTSILELGIDEPKLMRVVAYRLIDVGELDIAVQLFEDILEMRPEEPQSYRDLATVLAQRWENPGWRLAHPQQADQDISRAMALLHQVVFGRWDQRLSEIEVIALMELNRLMAKVDRLLPEDRLYIVQPELDSRLAGVLDVGLRIVLNWDSDLTDVDLWVTEPTGNHVFFSHPRSAIGGLLSRDFTQGYGPEEYVLKQPIAGEYAVRAKYYGSRQRTLLGPVTVKAVIFTNWAQLDETKRELTLRLDQVNDMADVGQVWIN